MTMRDGRAKTDRSSDILPRLQPWGSRPQAGRSTAGGSPLVRGGVVGRASAAPDRDSGLHLPPRRVRILTSDSVSQPTNVRTINVSPVVGFIPRLNSWAFASKLCNDRRGSERRGRASSGLLESLAGVLRQKRKIIEMDQLRHRAFFSLVRLCERVIVSLPEVPHQPVVALVRGEIQ